MSDLTNIHFQAEVRIHFPSWQLFNLENLTNDGVVLFCYLVFKCKDVPEWSHSDSSIQYELGIKRSRLETLCKRFVDMGFLAPPRVGRNEYNNKITFYRIDFNKLAETSVLKQIYRDKTQKGESIDLGKYSKAFKVIAQHQPKFNAKAAAKPNSKQQTSDTAIAKEFAKQLESIAIRDRKTFNENQRKKGASEAVGTLKFNAANIKALNRALNHFKDKQYIQEAFRVFVKSLNMKATGEEFDGQPAIPDDLRSPLNYFLSYSNKAGGTGGDWDEETIGTPFAFIYTCGNYYAAHYRTV